MSIMVNLLIGLMCQVQGSLPIPFVLGECNYDLSYGATNERFGPADPWLTE